MSLLVAMTVGAIVLTALQTSPIRPNSSELAQIGEPGQRGAAEAAFDTDVPMQPTKWRNVVLHGSAAERGQIADQCHFVIGEGGAVVVTGRWKQQVSGNHVQAGGRDWNADSIGICLMGDLDRQGPSRKQYQSLLLLVGTLQQYFNISADHVYLYRHLNARTRSPGEAFPAEDFASCLLRPRR